MPNRPVRLSHADRKSRRRDIADAYAGGVATVELMARFGCSQMTVYRACQQYDVPLTWQRAQRTGRGNESGLRFE